MTAQQDALRPLRMFVGALTGAAYGANDQAVVGVDASVASFPGQYQVVGPYGYSQEGTPIYATRSGGLVISPSLVMLGLGVAAALLWKR